MGTRKSAESYVLEVEKRFKDMSGIKEDISVYRIPRFTLIPTRRSQKSLVRCLLLSGLLMG
jgi:hypothetical protein